MFDRFLGCCEQIVRTLRAKLGRSLKNYAARLRNVIVQPVCGIPRPAAGKRCDILKQSFGPSRAYAQVCIPELVKIQASRIPDAVAVTCSGRALTYAELTRRAREIAAAVRTAGAGPGTVVGIFLERSFELVAGMLGVLEAGAAFLLLDRAIPAARVAFLLEDSNAKLLLTRTDLRSLLPRYCGQILEVDALQETPTSCIPQNAATVDDPAYIMYTSGSTGTPKGVSITHRAAVNYLSWMLETFGLTAADVVLQLASTSFDACIREFFGPLMAGARLVLIKEQEAKSPEAVLACMRCESVTCLLSVVPTMLRALAAACSCSLDFMRLVLVSGEVFTTADWQRAAEAFGWHVLFVNQYGPTECAMITTYHPVLEAPSAATVPIGMPIANVEVLLLDQRQNLVAIGDPGELCIGGVGLASGYLNNPKLTASKFIAHPFKQGKRLYRTGDLARYRADGTLEFLGRSDMQVKIRGQRVEPEEVEAVLRQHQSILDVAVVAQPGPDGDMRLVSYLIPWPGHAPTVESLRSFLVQNLPEYMIPCHFIFTNRFPRTFSGKVDRRALPMVDWLSVAAQGDYVAPRSATERLLAAILADVLQVGQIGVNDNFFHLGGHSLLATKVLGRINSELDAHLNVGDFFEHPTVGELARLLTVATVLPHETGCEETKPSVMEAGGPVESREESDP